MRSPICLPPRIASKISSVLPSGCWKWEAALTSGYGVVWWEGRLQRAHRVIYTLLIGPIPEGLELDHVRDRGCMTRACVNPEHCEPVTGIVNNSRSDSISARNARKTECLRGHAFTTSNTYVAKRERGKTERFCRECHRINNREKYHRRMEVKVAESNMLVSEGRVG